MWWEEEERSWCWLVCWLVLVCFVRFLWLITFGGSLFQGSSSFASCLWQVVVMSPPPPLPGSPYQQAVPPKWEEEEEQPDDTNAGDDRLGSKWCCVPLAISFLFLVNVLNYIDRGIVPGSSKEFVR